MEGVADDSCNVNCLCSHLLTCHFLLPLEIWRLCHCHRLGWSSLFLVQQQISQLTYCLPISAVTVMAQPPVRILPRWWKKKVVVICRNLEPHPSMSSGVGMSLWMCFMSVDFPEPGFHLIQKMPVPLRSHLANPISASLYTHWNVCAFA